MIQDPNMKLFQDIVQALRVADGARAREESSANEADWKPTAKSLEAQKIGLAMMVVSVFIAVVAYGLPGKDKFVWDAFAYFLLLFGVRKFDAPWREERKRKRQN